MVLRVNFLQMSPLGRYVCICPSIGASESRLFGFRIPKLINIYVMYPVNDKLQAAERSEGEGLLLLLTYTPFDRAVHLCTCFLARFDFTYV